MTEREREFLRYHEQGLTASEIAQKMGVTRSRVHKIRQQLKEKGVIEHGDS